MFYVFHGYVSPDNYDSSIVACYQVREFNNAKELEVFSKEFYEDIHNECTNIIFRVFEGKERFLVPKKIITSFKLD